MSDSRRATIDWSVPLGKQDWLLGTGATTLERAVVWCATAASVIAAVAVAVSEDVRWLWWHWALVLALTIDVAGGVTANALGSAKRFYHSPTPSGTTSLLRLLRHPVGFSALHIHPYVVLLLPDATLTWAVSWHLLCLVGTVGVVAVPLYLQRPAAAGMVTVILIVTSLLGPPTGLGWLGPVLFLKLVVSHAVREEPYRPRSRRGAGDGPGGREGCADGSAPA